MPRVAFLFPGQGAQAVGMGQAACAALPTARHLFDEAAAVTMVFFVLLHSGRGSGLSDMFGGALGATAAATSVGERNLDRITVILGLSFLGWFTLPVGIAVYLFELGLVATLQAFIFATLSAIYLGGSVTSH